MNKTESEKYFEKFCERNGLALNPIPVEAGRTPDFTLTVGGTASMVEVKEIDQTPEELASDKKMRETGVGNVSNITPGKKVRQKISDCYAQIKGRTRDTHPGLLVLWERGLCFGNHTEPYHIRVAMFGFEQVVISLPPLGSGESPSYAGMKHGGSRQMTDASRRSISAVAVLCMPEQEKMRLTVYHNRYATIPLDPTLLASAEVTHYVLEDDARGVTEWRGM